MVTFWASLKIRLLFVLVTLAVTVNSFNGKIEIENVLVSSNTMFVEIIPNAWIWYGKRWVKLEGLALKSLLEFFIRLDLTKIVTELLTKCWIAIVAMLMTSAPSLLGKRLIYLSKEKSSVTRWLDYFSIFGRLKQLKFTQRAQIVCQSRLKICQILNKYYKIVI